MEAHAVSFLQDNGVVVHFQMLSVVVMEFTAVLMDTLVVVESVLQEAKSCLCSRSYQLRRETLMWTVLFVQMEHLSVQMETHAVNLPQDNGVVVHFQMLSVVAMEYIAALMDTLAMFLLEPVVKEAKVYLC